MAFWENPNLPVEHPIGPGGEVPVVEGAIRPHPQDPDEQNLWAEADPMSSFVGVAQVEKSGSGGTRLQIS